MKKFAGTDNFSGLFKFYNKSLPFVCSYSGTNGFHNQIIYNRKGMNIRLILSIIGS